MARIGVAATNTETLVPVVRLCCVALSAVATAVALLGPRSSTVAVVRAGGRCQSDPRNW